MKNKIHFGKLYFPDKNKFIDVDVLRAVGKSNFFANGAPIDFKDLPLAGDCIQITLPKDLIVRMNDRLIDCKSKRYKLSVFASPAILQASYKSPEIVMEKKRSKAKNGSSARVKLFLFDYAMDIVRRHKNQSEFINRAIELALLNHD